MTERKRSIQVILALLQHRIAVVMFLVPLAFFALANILLRNMNLGTLMEFQTFRFFLVSLLTVLSVQTLISLSGGHLVSSLQSLGLLLLFLYPLFLGGIRFSADLNLGQGEPYSDYRNMSKGSWGTPPDEPVGFIDFDPESDQPVHLGIGSREYRVNVGDNLRVNGYGYTVSQVRMAPEFKLTGPQNHPIDSILVKVQADRSSEEYFQFSVLPYKFFILNPEQSAFSLLPGNNDGFPASISLGVSRGKIPVIQSTLGIDKPLSFEGLTMTYGEGAPWITLGINRTPPFPLWIPGILFLVSGFIIGMTCRQRTGT